MKIEELNRLASSRRRKRVWLWGGVVLVVLIVIGISVASVKSGGISTAVGDLSDPVTAADWQKGSTNPTATIVEYSDFQCPACGSYYSIIKELLTKRPDVALVYRHYPLPQHLQAKIAATAAEAAGAQGKFWEMHDMLFDNQAVWSDKTSAPEIFIGYAAALKLDLDQFRADVASATTTTAINDDLASGRRSRVNSTPTFFIDGEQVNNPAGVDEFIKLIDQTKNES
ncbi:MAG: DsbA family protein [Candidatus Vogelbacteria bacterium]|nr:DsbA family protein [Candidatus Vogelbacteria bacterium]